MAEEQKSASAHLDWQEPADAGLKHVNVRLEDQTSEEDSLTLFRHGDKLMVWIETPDGEASATMTQAEFEAFAVTVRTLMGWTA